MVIGCTPGVVILASSNTDIFLSPTTWTVPVMPSASTSDMPSATPSANRYVPNLSVNAFGCGHLSLATKLVRTMSGSGSRRASCSPTSFVRA